MAYYSQNDNAVAIVASDGSRSWVSLDSFLTGLLREYGQSVGDLSATRDELYINIVAPWWNIDQFRGPVGTVCIDLRTLKPRWAEDVIAVRGFGFGNLRVVVTKQNRLVLLEPDRQVRELLPDLRGITAWDYDPTTDRFVYIENGKMLHMVGPDRKWQWSRTAGIAYEMRTVSLVPGGAMVVERELGDDYGIASLSDTGKFLGWRAQSRVWFEQPLRVADKELLRRLERTAKKVSY
jgi:hypothetical protein